ncbi:hypothetical protein ACJX0J_016330, partial [Zea mays]
MQDFPPFPTLLSLTVDASKLLGWTKWKTKRENKTTISQKQNHYTVESINLYLLNHIGDALTWGGMVWSVVKDLPLDKAPRPDDWDIIKEDMMGALLALDIFKAFDSISWAKNEYPQKALKRRTVIEG